MNNGDSKKSELINQIIKGLKADITKVCKVNQPTIKIWTNASQKKGFLNWPDVPWLAFGGPRIFSDDAMSFSLNLNFQWPAHKRGVYLTILPFAIEWHQRFSQGANRVFEPYRKKFTDSLVHLESEGFSFDRDVDPGTRSEIARNMADMYIVHKFYPSNNLPSEQDIQRDIVSLLDAQQRLIRPDGPILWNVTLPVLDGYTEDSMLNYWLQYMIVPYGDPQLKGKDLQKLWAQRLDEPATRTNLMKEMLKMGIDEWKGDGLWSFINRMREGDRVNVLNGRGEFVANGMITPECLYDEESRIPLMRKVEWARNRGPCSTIDPNKAVILPRII